MKKIEAIEVMNIFAVCNNSHVYTEYYIKEAGESLHNFAVSIFEKLKTENTKSFSIYPYGNPEADAILEYEKYDDEEDFWVVPADDLFDRI